MKFNLVLVLASVFVFNLAFAQGRPNGGNQVDLTTPFKNGNTPNYNNVGGPDCTKWQVFKANATECARQLGEASDAVQANRNNDQIYNHYLALRDAAKNANVKVVLDIANTQNTAGNTANSSQTVYVSRGQNGQIQASDQASSGTSSNQNRGGNSQLSIGANGQNVQNNQNRNANNNRGANIDWNKVQKDNHLLDSDVEKLKNTTYDYNQLSENHQKKIDSWQKPTEINQLHDRLDHKQDAVDEAKGALTDAKSEQGFFGRMFHPSDKLKQARKDVNSAENARDAAQRDVDKVEKPIEKKTKKDNAKMQIGWDESGQYGGKYGGANLGTTLAINQGIAMVGQAIDQRTQQAMTDKNMAAQMALNSKGMSASQADAIGTNIKQVQEGANAIGKAANNQKMMATVMAIRAGQHELSKHKVDEAKMESDRNAHELMQEAAALRVAGDGVGAAEKEIIAKRQLANAEQNAAGERDVQTQAALQEGLLAYASNEKAKQLQAQKRMALQQADYLAAQANAITGGGFNFNPNAMNPNPDPGHNPNGDPNTPNQVTSNPPDNTQGMDAATGPFNPNMGDGGLNPPPLVPNQPGGPPTAGAPVGGGIQAAGGTTAAKDDSKGDAGPPGKAQLGGSYAAGDGGSGSRYSRGGGGGSGSESLADFFKKFLPGNDDVAKNEVHKEFADRSVASDQPSVLGRNKNIFEEVSKKYQVKSSEGAIVFTGDRT